MSRPRPILLSLLLLAQATFFIFQGNPALAGEWVYPKDYHRSGAVQTEPVPQAGSSGGTTTSVGTTTPSTINTAVPPISSESGPLGVVRQGRKASSSATSTHATTDLPSAPNSPNSGTEPNRSEREPGSANTGINTPASPASSAAIQNALVPLSTKVTTTTTTTMTSASTTGAGHVDRGLKPFLAALRANFSQWDLNHDGVLDRQELDTCAQDFKYTGDAAIVLAVLKKQADGLMNKDPKAVVAVKLADMDAVEAQAQAGEKLPIDYGSLYRSLQSKVNMQPRQLFTGALPHLSKIHQGWTGDCYFLSTLGGLCDTNPRAIIDMIQTNRDGTYTVTFPGRQPMVVPPPTETEIAAYTDAADGFWLNILEKAFGRVRVLSRGKIYTAEPLDTAALYGGFSSEVIPILTGHKAQVVNFQTTQAKAQGADALAASARKAITESFANGKIVTASKMSHAYTVTEYDTTKDMVKLHNPWGTNAHERWPDGTVGPQMELGYFSCSMADFVKYYRCLFYEM